MQSVCYRIHDLVSIRIQGLSAWVLKDLNTKLHYFSVDSLTQEPDIEVHAGPFSPSLEGTCSVDQRYHMKRGYLYFYEEDKGLRWEAEIHWKESGKIFIRYFAPAANRFKLPWMFFPEMVLHHYILIPLLEELLIQKGCYLLHAAGAEKNGEAVLWIGRGGTYKTTHALRSLEKGYRLLGDDFVLVKGRTIYSFPTSPLWLEFTREHLKEERLNLWDQCRLAAFLFSPPPAKIPYAQHARLERGILLVSYDGNSPEDILSADPFSSLERIVTNQLLERNAYVSYRYRIGQFLEAYDYAFPGIRGIAFEAGLRHLVTNTFAEIPLKVKKVNLDFDPKVFENSDL